MLLIFVTFSKYFLFNLDEYAFTKRLLLNLDEYG